MNPSSVHALLSGPASWQSYRSSLPGRPQPDLTGANLEGADLTGADVTGADLTGANLGGLPFEGVDLTGANLTRANLTDANLTHAIIDGANLTRAILTRAILTHAMLERADLTDATLNGANLTHTYLEGANLTRVDLTGANLTDVRIDELTVDAAGRLLTSHLNPVTDDDPLEEGVTSLKVGLPPHVDPQILADCTMAVAVMARLASRVGAQLERNWFEKPARESRGSVLVSTSNESGNIVVRRANYGSPLIVELYEFAKDIAIGAGAAIPLLTPPSRRLISFLVVLARKEERELYFNTRVELRAAAYEEAAAKTASAKKSQIESRRAVASLHIEPAPEEEFVRRIIEALPDDPETREQCITSLPAIMPLLANGIIVTAVI